MVKVAFVSVESAGHSWMAASFARAIAHRGVEILSGGTFPAKEVDPVVVGVLREVGLDLSHERLRRIGPKDLANCDVVVTIGCAAEYVRPASFRGDALDRALRDPKGKSKAEVRDIRDEVERRVKALLAEVSPRAGSEV